MQAVKDTVNSAVETVQGYTAQASKEGNKEVAKDSNADASTRLTAGKDAIGDKLNQSSHEGKSEAYSQKASAE